MENDVFRLALLALGSCVIAAVLGHGIWVSRKNSNKNAEKAENKPRKQQFQPSGWQEDGWHDENEISSSKQKNDVEFNIDIDNVDNEAGDTDVRETQSQSSEFDDLGLGPVRIVSGAAAQTKDNQQEPSSSKASEDLPNLADFKPSGANKKPEVKPASGGKVYASVVSQPKPEYLAKYGNGSVRTAPVFGNGKTIDDHIAPEPPPFLLKSTENPTTTQSQVDVEALKKSAQQAIRQPSASSEANKSNISQETPVVPEKVSLAEQARNLVMGKKVDGSGKKRREPKLADEQMRIDFENEAASKITSDENAARDKTAKSAPVADTPQEVLVLNVKSSENNLIQGAALLPMLLTLGFKFGDQDIFHRHVNANGKGPVLFSLANMFKPGNFDIDSLETFTTQGLSLFMILPIEGDPHQVFNMMHNAARKLADEFSAQVYDGRRTLLTKQSLQQYVEKIREFERKRLANR